MEREELARTLIAKFSPGQHPFKEFPRSIRWQDGTPATNDDYESHMLDTFTITGDVEKGIEIRVFPNIVADVRFDDRRGAWMMSGEAVIPTTVDLTDPNAQDDQIIAKLFPCLVVYKTAIHRP